MSKEDFHFLTPRQRDVYSLRASGLRDQEVADRLGIARRTVELHFQEITQRAEIYGYAWRRALVQVPKQ